MGGRFGRRLCFGDRSSRLGIWLRRGILDIGGRCTLRVEVSLGRGFFLQCSRDFVWSCLSSGVLFEHF